jgi:6,7-dimethyl-8-ribityllumazine synthase
VSGEGRPAGPIVDAAGVSLAIVATRWHAEITDTLVERAVAAAHACGVTDPLVIRVPGAVELPVVAAELAARHDAVACLGAVIRGGTPHFEYVCDAVTYGIGRVALDTRTPIGNGVLTCDDIKQAQDRSGAEGAAEDKGWETVLAALETALVLRRLRPPAPAPAPPSPLPLPLPPAPPGAPSSPIYARPPPGNSRPPPQRRREGVNGVGGPLQSSQRLCWPDHVVATERHPGDLGGLGGLGGGGWGLGGP